LYWGSLVTTIFFNLMSIPAIMHSAIAINWAQYKQWAQAGTEA
jgi:hypothetical protein